jgi:hypothetical protein
MRPGSKKANERWNPLARLMENPAANGHSEETAVGSVSFTNWR